MQIDLRFGNPDEGDLEIVVAPIARFMDVPFNSKFTIEQIGNPEKIINGFHPEIYGKPLQVRRCTDSEDIRTCMSRSCLLYLSAIANLVQAGRGEGGDGGGRSGWVQAWHANKQHTIMAACLTRGCCS